MMRSDVKVGADTRGGGIFQCRQRLVIGEFGGHDDIFSAITQSFTFMKKGRRLS